MRDFYTAALVGTGRIGFSLGFDKKREQPASHTMALLGNKRIRLIAGADTDSQKLAEWAGYVGRKSGKKPLTFASSAEMYKAFAGGELAVPDLITVAVNEESHLSECLAAIAAQPRLVILEKPVALNTEQAVQIAMVAEEYNVPVMVNHERRFAADYNAAKAYMKKIGRMQSVRGELYSGLRIYGEQYEKDGAYSLIHDGTHLVDIIRFLLDDDLTSPVVTGIFKDEEGLVRNFSAHYTTAACPDVTISMSGRSRFFSFGLDILGTEGRICIGNGYAKFYQRKESKLYTGFYSLSRDRSVHLPKKTGYFSGMIQNAVDFLDGSDKIKSPLVEAISDLRALEEIKKYF